MDPTDVLDATQLALISALGAQQQPILQNSSEIADQPRIVEETYREHFARPGPFYCNRITGKWWSVTQEQSDSVDDVARRNITMIGRIMETIYGVQLFGDDRCDECKKQGTECWAFTEHAMHRIPNAGGRCARCRDKYKSGGCSLTRRTSIANTPAVTANSSANRPSPSPLMHGVMQYPIHPQGSPQDARIDPATLESFGLTEADIQLTGEEQQAFAEGNFGNVEGLISSAEYLQYFYPL